MLRHGLRPTVCVLSLALALGACQTLARSGTETATVDLGDPATRAAVAQALAKAVDRGRVELGEVRAQQTSVVVVLPPRVGLYETNSVAMPIRFHIQRIDGKCVAVRDDTGATYDLAGVACTAEPS